MRAPVIATAFCVLCFIACSSDSTDKPSGDPRTGDPGSATGDPVSGDPTSGDAGQGDPASGDPVAGDPVAGDPASGDSMECQNAPECGFGFDCDNGTCVELECHLGQWDPSIEDKPCGAGLVCDLLTGSTGSGVCVALSTICNFDFDCPFGYLCTTGHACELAGCTMGNMTSNYGLRPCTTPTDVCCMEDGVALNGGRGRCADAGTGCP